MVQKGLRLLVFFSELGVPPLNWKNLLSSIFSASLNVAAEKYMTFWTLRDQETLPKDYFSMTQWKRKLPWIEMRQQEGTGLERDSMGGAPHHPPQQAPISPKSSSERSLPAVFTKDPQNVHGSSTNCCLCGMWIAYAMHNNVRDVGCQMWASSSFQDRIWIKLSENSLHLCVFGV